MKRDNSDQILSAVFVDYDNIYLSLKRKSEDAARAFAKDAPRWLAALQNGGLITPGPSTATTIAPIPRRTVMNRCYGNPVPRRNQNDNSTDMNSFPFIRHHFLRAGFEIIDCPPLTAQLKNSSDIRMVMDLRDYLTHETYFDEFIILSSDADFTPVLHRLRAHNRRTVIFANDNTAAPYTAIADAEIRENDLIELLLSEAAITAAQPSLEASPAAAAIETELGSKLEPEQIRAQIIEIIADAVRSAPAPLPLEAAAERATRILGHEATVGSSWAGAGSFIDLLRDYLPQDVRLSSQTPPVLYDQSRIKQSAPRPALAEPAPATKAPATAATAISTEQSAIAAAQAAAMATSGDDEAINQASERTAAAARLENAAIAKEKAQVAAEIQQSIAKIHEASQAPPLSPPDYAALFQELAAEIEGNELQGVQTLSNVEARLRRRGIEIGRDDIRFVLGVVGEQDPWFEQGASASLFAGRFRNFVVARCRSQNVTLSTQELDLVERWFAGQAATTRAPQQIQEAPEPTIRDDKKGGGDAPWWETGAEPPTQAPYDTSVDAFGAQHDQMPRVLRS